MTKRDKAGLMRTDVQVNSMVQEMVVDTGANLSVLSSSAAKRLGVRILDGQASVGTATGGVATRLGIADHLEVAGLSVSNVVFLVLDDRNLELPLPGGYRIDGILGFPVLREMQRITVNKDGMLTPQRAASNASRDGQMRVIGSNVYVAAKLNGHLVPLHFDTGAPRSNLSPTFAKEHPEIVKGLATKEEQVAGAGGSAKRQSALWKDVEVTVGNATTTLVELPIATAPEGGLGDYGVLGGDVLGAFESWTIDFARMTFDLAPSESPERGNQPD